MSPAFLHFLDLASQWGRAALLIVCLYKLWPRKRHGIQVFQKTTPAGFSLQRPSNNSEFRSRLVVCLFVGAVLCFALPDLFRRTFLPPAPPPAVALDSDPAPAPTPKIARASTAQYGDVVKIVCGGGQRCAVAATAPDAVKLDTGQIPSGKVFYVKNGTKAIVLGYDPQDTGSDTADVYILAGADATSITLSARSDPAKKGCIPGRWMHKLQTQESVTVYQTQDKQTL